MKESTLSTIRQHFRFKSVFLMVFTAMVLLCLGLCSVFSIFFAQNIIRNTIRDRVSANQTHLNGLVSSTDTYISQLHQSLTQLSSSRSALALAFSSSLQQSRVNDALTDLILAKDTNPLVASSILYMPRMDCIITSSYTVHTFDDYVGNSLLASYENGDMAETLLEQGGKTTSIFFHNRSLWMVRDFPLRGNRRLGTVYYKVNMDILYSKLKDGLADDTQLWVFDSRSEPVFTGEVQYPPCYDAALLQTLRDNGNYMLMDDTALFLACSKTTGWQYLYMADYSSLRPTARQVAGIMAPLLFFVLGAALAASYLITAKLYKPFRQLLDTIEQGGMLPLPTAAGNELDYLSDIFSETTDRQLQLNTMMQAVSQDVVRQTFMNLLLGIQIAPDRLETIFSNVKSPFPIHGAYVVSVVCFREPMSLNCRATLSKILESGLQDFSRRENALYQLIPVDNKHMAVILVFSFQSSILEIRRQLKLLRDQWEALSVCCSVPILAASGKICHSILDIGFSYEEAVKTAQDGIDSRPQVPQSLCEGPAEGFDAVTRAQQIISQLRSGDPSGAEILCRRLVEEAARQANTPEILSKNYAALFSALADEIARLEYVDFSQLSNELFTFCCANGDPDILSDAAADRFHRILQELAKILKRQQHPSILAAQRFIDAHYNDSTLSLNSVADEIGVSLSYLCKLFKSNLGINFTDYLNHCRVERSLPLLLKKDIPIKGIALLCGFTSAQNYIRVFKKYKNCTPGEWRAKDDSHPR